MEIKKEDMTIKIMVKIYVYLYFWTCVEDHEVVCWIPLQHASVHIDVVSHGNRAVSEGSGGHTPGC